MKNLNDLTNYEASKVGIFKKFLWWCAGGDPLLLKIGTYTDQVKFACMGGTVLSTAILAFLAGTYAFHTVFNTDPKANITIYEALFGLVWGIIIFNIDRFIVSSTQPKIDKKTFIETFKGALPRILMGIVISLIISKPLELKIFEKDIELEIAKTKEDKFLEIKKATKAKFKNEEDLINNKIAKYDKQIKDLELEYAKYDSLFQVEARIITVGPRAKAMQNGKAEAENKINSIKNSTEYKSILNERDSLFIKIADNAEIERKNVEIGMRSLVNKIKLSHKISPSISFMITLLFIILELTPIIFKLLMEKSPIDYLLFNRNEIIKASQLIEENKTSEVKSIIAEKLLIRLKEENLKKNERILREYNLKTSELEKSNNIINDTKNQNYLNTNTEIVDVVRSRLIKQNQAEINKIKLEFENNEILENINKEKINKYKTTEDALDKYTIEEYEKISKHEIGNNPIDAYQTRIVHKKDLSSNKNRSSINSKTKDDIIKDKYWSSGEEYSFTYVLTKDYLKNELKISDDKLSEAFNDTVNQIKTSSKISQFKKSKNLIEWANESNNIEKFNLDKSKLNEIHQNAITKLKTKYS